MRRCIGLVLVLGVGVGLCAGQAAAQTSLFVSDYYKVTTYLNLPAAGDVTPATISAKQFEVMITPKWPAFLICVYTEVLPSEANPTQKRTFAKKLKWQANGGTTGDRLGKGIVKTKEGEVGCKQQTGFDRASASAEEDTLIIWSAEFVMRGNRQFEGTFGPAIWVFPFIPSAADGTASIRREGVMSLEQFQEMRRRFQAVRGARSGPLPLVLPE